jgi:hypothetical protein
MSPDELRVEVDEGIVWPQVCFVSSARARPYADLARSCAASRRFPTFLSSRHAAAKVIQYPHATMACTAPAAQGWRGPLYGFDRKHFERSQKNSPCNRGLSAERGRTVPITAVGAIGGMPGRRREESQRPPVDRGFLRDIAILCTLASTTVRLRQRLGLERRARNVTPSLGQYLAARTAPVK